MGVRVKPLPSLRSRSPVSLLPFLYIQHLYSQLYMYMCLKTWPACLFDFETTIVVVLCLSSLRTWWSVAQARLFWLPCPRWTPTAAQVEVWMSCRLGKMMQMVRMTLRRPGCKVTANVQTQHDLLNVGTSDVLPDGTGGTDFGADDFMPQAERHQKNVARCAAH